MGNFKLMHYSETPIEKLDLDKMYPYYLEFPKPNGLWVTVEGDQCWKQWCLDEEFNLEGLSYKYEVLLHSYADILLLDTPQKIKDLGKDYKYSDALIDQYMGGIDWKIDWLAFKSKYKGIIISPYYSYWSLASIRRDVHWYYGWDCASGCIWDLSCVKEFNFIEHKIYTKEEECQHQPTHR